MNLITKILRSQLFMINKIADVCSIKKSRYVQDKIGGFMAYEYHDDVTYNQIESVDFQAEFVVPKHIKNNGVILYIHGGGYVSGGMQYAKGFGTVLAMQNHIKVCCLAYRLAPEFRFPAALDDAFDSYKYLLDSGYKPEQIVLCGESAGGGLVFALALKIKAEKLPMPCGIVAVSPWTDLSMSGVSYETNCKKDPSMTKKRLQFYAENYSDQISLPFVSPLNGELSGLPTSLIFSGGDEIMLSDAVLMHKKLIESGCQSELVIAPDMWHIYLLYNIKEAKKDRERISSFLQEVLK